jgi:hypothetical protein
MESLKNSNLFLAIWALMPIILMLIGAGLITYSLIKAKKNKERISLKILFAGIIIIIFAGTRLNEPLVRAIGQQNTNPQNKLINSEK